jgi:hypothetical protein
VIADNLDQSSFFLSCFSSTQLPKCTKCSTNFSFQAHLYFLHIIKGTPWISPVDRDQSRETHWEQLDSGKYWTDQKKFLTLAPIVLFFLTCLYTQNSEAHFVINFVSLVVVTAPKFPIFHHRRLFNINKY